MAITVNADMGEGIGLHAFGNDEELMTLIDVANVACGYHASDPQIMDSTIALAAKNGVAVGAHPSYPDLVGFGRRVMALTPEEVENMVRYQVGALHGFLVKHGLKLNHIKPHGALYGVASREPDIMRAIAVVAKDYGVPIFGRSNTVHEQVCAEMGVDFVGELYVDLNYSAEGDLIIERKPKPADPVAAAERVKRALTTGEIDTVDGGTTSFEFSSVCVHSDPHNAAEVVAAVSEAISQNS